MTDAPRRNWASWAIVLVGGAVMIAGLAVVGGPGQARKEQRDETRMAHLRELGAHATCLATQSGALSARMDTTADCGSPPDVSDPLTGQPYQIELLDSGNLRICAEMEAQDALERRRAYYVFERDGNCIVVSNDRDSGTGGRYQPVIVPEISR